MLYMLYMLYLPYRGYGDTDKPLGKTDYRMELLIEDIAQLIPALGYSSCVLGAHDWGGVVAWYGRKFLAAFFDPFLGMCTLSLCIYLPVYFLLAHNIGLHTVHIQYAFVQVNCLQFLTEHVYTRIHVRSLNSSLNICPECRVSLVRVPPEAAHFS